MSKQRRPGVTIQAFPVFYIWTGLISGNRRCSRQTWIDNYSLPLSLVRTVARSGRQRHNLLLSPPAVTARGPGVVSLPFGSRDIVKGHRLCSYYLGHSYQESRTPSRYLKWALFDRVSDAVKSWPCLCVIGPFALVLPTRPRQVASGLQVV